jgi:hypothetical protein
MGRTRPKSLEELVRELPEDLQQEVRSFIEDLLEQRSPAKPVRLRLEWAGALREYRDRFTSVDLQHKVLEWWVSDIQREG